MNAKEKQPPRRTPSLHRRFEYRDVHQSCGWWTSGFRLAARYGFEMVDAGRQADFGPLGPPPGNLARIKSVRIFGEASVI